MGGVHKSILFTIQVSFKKGVPQFALRGQFEVIIITFELR